jgi:hypothetical protein
MLDTVSKGAEKMKIDGARIEGGELIFQTTDPAARRLVWDFKPGEYDLVKATKKRSRDANAKCWAMCEEIARAVGITKEEVYRRNIKEVGSYTPLVLANHTIENFKKIWAARGIGWFAEITDDVNDNCKLVFAYHGSSSYNTAEMARLIDNIIQDAKSVGLDPMSERERSLLLMEWGKKNEE